MTLRYGTLCSGISAASVAWKPLGWEPVFFAEIAGFPSAVLAHHYPEVPNHGDFTGLDLAPGSVDLLAGGTPCQSFSVAGHRGGLADDRGNLALEYGRLLGRARPRWFLWENVPGCLTSGGGADFAAILAGFTGMGVTPPPGRWGNSGLLIGPGDGYSVAWRVLDAQHFGVPQRRRRVILVGHRGDWRGAAAVLFDPAGPGRHRASVPPSGSPRAHTLCAGGFDASEDGCGRGRPIFDTGSGPRYSTPREWERLQGFPDDYTLIPYRGRWAADASRYHALGNSMAVPVLVWVGQRLQWVDAVLSTDAEAA